MSDQKTQDLIFDTLTEKSLLKRDVCENTILNFKILKQTLKTFADQLSTRVAKVDNRIRVEYRDKGDYEAQLWVAGDVMVFHMHTNVFQFDSDNSLWRTSYLKDNANRGYCGIINIYNFLADSFTYNRVNDSGYLIGRMFVNSENHYMLQGKRQLGFLYNDFINAVLDKDAMEKIVESAILYSLDFDLFTPPYEQVQEVSVGEIQALSDNSQMRTGKRLGFMFQADSDEVS